MLKKLFNSKNKYFLELDELKESEAVQTAVETTKKVASVAKETASEVVDTAQEKLQSAIATEEKPAESKVKTPEKSDKSQAKVKAKGKSDKSQAKDKAKDKSKELEDKAEQNGSAQAQNSEVKTVENTGASSYDPPFWVAAMYNNNSSKEKGNGRVAEQTFAPENLMPIATKFRRRPGGSLDKFKDMAKQAKTPKG